MTGTSHLEATRALVELEDGALEAGSAASVVAHLEECAPCQEWIETYRLLATTLGSKEGQQLSHPNSELLACWALRPDDLDELEEAQVSAHVRSCRACRQATELVHKSTLEARLDRSPPTWRHRATERLGAGPRLLVAAGLAAALIGSIALFASLSPFRRSPAAGTETEGFRYELSDGHEVSDHQLSGLEIYGSQSIEAGETLGVSNVKIRNGAMVTLRSKQRVALGNGFIVDLGARATIGTTQNGPQED